MPCYAMPRAARLRRHPALYAAIGAAGEELVAALLRRAAGEADRRLGAATSERQDIYGRPIGTSIESQLPDAPAAHAIFAA